MHGLAVDLAEEAGVLKLVDAVKETFSSQLHILGEVCSCTVP